MHEQVGVYIKHLSPHMFEWDHLIRCTIDSAGAWKIDSASYGLYTAANWNAVWEKQYEDLYPGRAHIASDEISKNDKAFLQAQEIMSGQHWEAKDNRWTIT
jgi:hypothetical protein